jgi:hypothetical protein
LAFATVAVTASGHFLFSSSDLFMPMPGTLEAALSCEAGRAACH